MSNNSPEKLVKAIHRRTRRKYSAEEKIRIVLEVSTLSSFYSA